MNATTELQRLVALLLTESPELEITFREESARDIRYTLVVASCDNTLLCKLARIFGCRDERLPFGRGRFEAGDDWHGRGEVNLRDLADEFFVTDGQFFDFDVTIGELRLRAREA